MNALTIFQAIYQSQSKHSRLLHQHFFLKKKIMAPFMEAAQLYHGYIATTSRQFFFLLLRPQEYLVLISSTSKE